MLSLISQTMLAFYRHLDLHSLHVNCVVDVDFTNSLHRLVYIHVKVQV